MKTIKKGDKLSIKPEWMDAGDENYTFYSIDDQLDGMKEIRMRAIRNVDGEPAIGIQSIRIDMIQ